MNEMYYMDREGKKIPVPVSNNQMLARMFSNVFGRMALKVLSSRWYSNVQRAAMSTHISAFWISDFVKKNGISLKEYERCRYTSFHDFFKRKIKPSARPMTLGERVLMSPCDAKASVYPITEEGCFQVKGVPYTVKELLKSEELAQKYMGGYLYLLRLCVEDYHHYYYPVSGGKTKDHEIPGKLFTVHPMIHQYEKVYRENARVYCELLRPCGDWVLMMEVGALGVGRVVNDEPGTAIISQGTEKGHFEFGGSTIILLTQKDMYLPSEELLRHTAEDYETIVKLGEGLGYENDTKSYKKR